MASASNAAAATPVIVVCQVFHPDEQSTSQLLSDVVRALVARGHAVVVLSGFPGLEDAAGTPRRENWDGVLIRRGGLRVRFKRNLLWRALSYASYSAFVAWQLLCAPRGSRVFVVSNPPFNPVLVALIGRIKRLSWIAMLQDIYPQGLTALGRLRTGGWIDRLWRRANRAALATAHETWVLGRDMVELVHRDYGVPLARVRCVPHWSPVPFAERVTFEQTKLADHLGLRGKFVVQYSGNMGLWHDIDTIIRAAELLADRDDIRFLLIGAGRKRAAAEQLAQQLGLKNIVWLPYQPRGELMDSLACCHAALISQLAGLVGIAVPCKLYGILASGRAIIGQVPAASEVASVIAEEHCGVVVPPGDAVALAAAIATLAGEPDEVERMGAASFAAYREKYTLEAGADSFELGWREWRTAALP